MQTFHGHEMDRSGSLKLLQEIIQMFPRMKTCLQASSH